MAARREPLTIGVPGLILVITGAVLLLFSFTALSWYGSSAAADSVGRITFSKLHTFTQSVPGSRSSRWYFSWAAWLMLLAVVLVGLLANLPLPNGGLVLRMLGFLIGIGGAFATWFSLHKIFQNSHQGVFDHARVGVWFALIGFPLAGLGALIGTGGPVMAATGKSKGRDENEGLDRNEGRDEPAD